MSLKQHLILLAFAGFSSNLLATSGTFTHGIGTKSKALAGAGVALPLDALSAGTNPANAVFVGNRMDIGFALFSPIREYSVTGATPQEIGGAFQQASQAGQIAPGSPPPFALETGTFSSDNELFMIPHFGRNWMLNDHSAFAISLFGNGGMNAEYNSNQFSFAPVDPQGNPVGRPSTFYAGTTSIDLRQLFFTPTYAMRLGDNFALGVSAVFAYQQLAVTGLGSFAPFVADGNPNDLSNNGHSRSLGAGGKFGLTANMGSLAIGLSAQSKIYMSEFDEYADLLVDKGDFDVPATATLGFAFKASDGLAILFDIQQIWYSDVDSFGNSFSRLTSQTGCLGGVTSSCLGGSNGVGFGWDDITIYKLGVQFSSSSDMTWRAGYSHGDQPIQSSEVLFNILAPATIQNHLTAGFTKKLAKNNEIDIAIMIALKEKVKGGNPLAPAPLPAQNIELSMKQFELEVNWSWLF